MSLWHYVYMETLNKGENKMINHEVKLEEVARLVKGLKVEDMERLQKVILDHEIAVAHHQKWALENKLKGAA